MDIMGELASQINSEFDHFFDPFSNSVFGHLLCNCFTGRLTILFMLNFKDD